jgi:hypothetical protein
VHIRRGDRLRQALYRPNGSRCAGTGSVSLDADTQPGAVEATLRRLVPPTLSGQNRKPVVFVQTNEKNLTFFSNLKKPFTALQFFDIPAFKLVEMKDNYLLYMAEKAIFDDAALRIFTFTNPERGQTIALSNCMGFH